MQIIYQDPYESLDPRFRVRDTIEEPLLVHGLAGKGEERARKVADALVRAGLTPPELFLDRYPHELSGGQRQRVAIAAGLALEPELLVADEPVSMLDVSIRAGILALLDSLRKSGLGILMITHDLSTAAHYADRIAVMYLGRIVEEGPALEVVGNPRHPYTQALISVVPKPDPRDRTTAQILTGETPNPLERSARLPFPSALPRGFRALSGRRSGGAPADRLARSRRRLLAARRLTQVRQRWTLAACCCAQFLILLDVTTLNVALPSIQRELGVAGGNLVWVINAYVLPLASLILLAGTLGDRYGRRRVFLAGFVLFTVFSVGCALSTSDELLIVFRALQGAGAALLAPLSLSILVDAYPPERRAWAIGIWATVAGIGFGGGPIVGGLLIELFDWSAIFWMNVPIGIAGALLTLAFVRESRDPNARRLDLLGAALVSAGLFCLTFALIETDQHAWTS